MDLRAARGVALVRQDPALAGSGGDDPLAVRLHAGAEQGRAPAGERAADRSSRRSASSARASWAPASPMSRAQAGIEVVLIDRDQEAADKGKAHSHKLMTDQVNKRPRHRGRARRAAGAHHARRADYGALAGLRPRRSRRCSRTARSRPRRIAKAQAVIGDKRDLRAPTPRPCRSRRWPESREGPGAASSASISSRRSSA